MKKVILYWAKTNEDETWARQFAGDDAQLVQEYQPSKAPPGTELPDFPIRQRIAINAGTPTWAALIQGIQGAATAAGRDGVVVLLGGHGGSDCRTHDDQPKLQCLPNVATVFFDPDKRLGFNQHIVTYTQPRRDHMNTSLHDEDEQAIQGKGPIRMLEVGKDRPTTPRQRMEMWRNYERIGGILRSNRILRFVFLSCALGSSRQFLDQVADAWGVQVAAFNSQVTVMPPDNYTDRKARFVFRSDAKRPGYGTNIPRARVFTPSLDNPAIAYVGKPNPGTTAGSLVTAMLRERVRSITASGLGALGGAAGAAAGAVGGALTEP
jgi:hypothetical protein